MTDVIETDKEKNEPFLYERTFEEPIKFHPVVIRENTYKITLKFIGIRQYYNTIEGTSHCYLLTVTHSVKDNPKIDNNKIFEKAFSIIDFQMASKAYIDFICYFNTLNIVRFDLPNKYAEFIKIEGIPYSECEIIYKSLFEIKDEEVKNKLLVSGTKYV